MAQIANAYYNSPWIADAARNLASALRPPDQDQLLAREKNRFELDYLKTKSENETTDRANAERSRTAIGRMYDVQKNPILGADGKPDQAATEKHLFELAEEAMTYGPKDVRAEVDNALSVLSPTFAKKMLLQKVGAGYAEDRLTRSLSGAMQRLTTGNDFQREQQDDRQDFELERLDKLYGLRLNELNAKTAAAAAKAGQPPLTITPALGKAIWGEVLRRERATKHPLTDEARFAMVAEIANATQTSRDPYSSSQEIWNARFPQSQYTDAATQKVPETDSDFGINNFMRAFGFTPYDTYLAPTEAPAPAPVAAPAGDGSLGVAAITNPFRQRGLIEADTERLSREAAAAENAALPPASSKPKQPAPASGKGKKKPVEGQTAKSKSGKPMIFHNGRWEAQ